MQTLNEHERNISETSKLVLINYPLVNLDFIEENPIIHIQRKKLVEKMIKVFTNYMKRYIEIPDYLTLIRWFYTQKLLDFHPTDPLLPYNTNYNEGLYYELDKLNVPKSEIKELSTLLNTQIKSFNTNMIGTDTITVNLSQNEYHISYQDTHFKLIESTYEKLRNLYNSNTTIEDKDLFHLRLFNLLCRYETLPAPGYHAAIPTELFDLIKQELKVEHELFASPFNCNKLSYTSAYPDVDKYFGSKGNLFNVYKKIFEKGGSFEANPPFLEEHMTMFSLMITNELKVNKNPLSFVVIYPAWLDAISLKILNESEYNVLPNKIIKLERNKHYYVQSAQYWIKNVNRVANCNTAIFILQNEAGKMKYKISDKLIEDIYKTFSF